MTRNFLLTVFAVALSNCALLPIDEHTGGVTIDAFKNSIECEIAAVAIDPRYSSFLLRTWHVKASVDMTIVNTVSADGKATVLIPTSITLPTVSPSGSLTGKFTNVGHLDFAVSVPDAITKYGETCVGPDPSQTKMGLAGWITATLDQISPENHGGLSYSVDVDVTASAGSRFGFVFSGMSTLDAGPSFTREGVHHLVVTMTIPTPDPGPLLVRIVGPTRVNELNSTGPRISGSSGTQPNAPNSRSATRGQQGYIYNRAPALYDPTNNQLLLQQQPVRIVPGTVLR